MLVALAPRVPVPSREPPRPVHSNSAGDEFLSVVMFNTPVTSVSMARITANKAPGTPARGRRKFTQAIWELTMLRVGPPNRFSSPLRDDFHHLMPRLAKNPTTPPGPRMPG